MTEFLLIVEVVCLCLVIYGQSTDFASSCVCVCVRACVCVRVSVFILCIRAGKSVHRYTSALLQQAVFSDITKQWINTADSCCNNVVSHHAADLVCEGDSGVVLCKGVRVYEQRSFQLKPPPVLIFNVHEFYCSGVITSLEGIPCQLLLHLEGHMQRYVLIAATFFSSGHYSATLRVPQLGWFYYDGLCGADDRLQFVGTVENIPLKCISHVFFYNEMLLQ